MSSELATMALDNVVYQHVDVASMLCNQRRILLTAPHVRLLNLSRLDERLEAHLDAMAVSAASAARFCAGSLESPSASSLFVATIQAIETETLPLPDLFSLAQADTTLIPGLLAALGWLDLSRLREWIPRMLNSRAWFAQVAGIAACGMHRVDPGLTAARRFEDENPWVRARAWRTAGEIGKREWVSTAAAAIGDEDPACRFWAAWAAVLLGDRHGALDFLAGVAQVAGPFRARAFQLVLQARSVPSAHAWLAAIGQDPASLRWLISGSGLVGDPKYIPWLIGQMADNKFARAAGEAFSLMTGADLAALELERKPPEGFESGPDDNPDHSDVSMDADDGLAWPDPARVQAWWAANSSRFQPGLRHFMGEPLNVENCQRVLRSGYQRQRITAALYLSLLNPGTPLFEWRAPARRQQRLLAS